MAAGLLTLATAIVVGGEAANAELRFVEAATKAAVAGIPAIDLLAEPFVPTSGPDPKASIP